MGLPFSARGSIATSLAVSPLFRGMFSMRMASNSSNFFRSPVFLAVWKVCLGQHFRINGQNIFPKCFVNHVPGAEMLQLVPNPVCE